MSYAKFHDHLMQYLTDKHPEMIIKSITITKVMDCIDIHEEMWEATILHKPFVWGGLNTIIINEWQVKPDMK